MNQERDSEKPLPPSLFKYQPINLNTLRNLQSQSLFFGSPSKFNDPNDCAIKAQLQRLLQRDVPKIREDLLSEFSDDELEIDQLRDELSGLGRVALRDRVQLHLHQFVERSREDWLRRIGATCFSEKNSNLLMWSHYADGGRGLCLEFDTAYDPMTRARPVGYPPAFPLLDPIPILLEDDFSGFIDLFCTKSQLWNYEEEWRALHSKAGTSFGYEARALKALYFGPEASLIDINLVCLILHGQNPDVRLLQGTRSESSYAVEFTEFTYTPWKDRPALSEVTPH